MRSQQAPASTRERFSLEIPIKSTNRSTVLEILATASGLSRTQLKIVMQKGAVWVRHGTHRPQRQRRVTWIPAQGDCVELHYDARVLAHAPPAAVLQADHVKYSVWYKPSGLLVEGSRYGDHATLLRQVETQFTPTRKVFLVHRLDLEASGLIVLAHNKSTAAYLSECFRTRQVTKEYWVIVHGEVGKEGDHGSIDSPLDDKPAHTNYRVLYYDAVTNHTWLQIDMRTGRYHQIRLHCAALGYPVIGDVKHGGEPTPEKSLRLAATRLSFIDAASAQSVTFSLPPQWPEIDAQLLERQWLNTRRGE